jgi:TonB family protein
MNFISTFLIVVLFIWTQHLSATASSHFSIQDHSGGDTIPLVVDEEAAFPGGQGALYRYIADHLKYPDKALEDGIEGIVYLRFIVEKDGSLSNIEVIRSDSPDLNQAAMNALASSPRWIPAKVDGEPVRTIHILPVHFKLSQ